MKPQALNTMQASRSLPLPPSALPLAAVALAAALLAGPARAQTVVPDAGQVLRETRPPAAVLPRGGATLAVPAETDAAADAGQAFPVASVRIEGNQRVATEALRPHVAGLEGREVTLGELRDAARAITQHYRALGYVVARAYLPAQRIADGSVRIVVLESTMTSTAVDNRSALRDDVLKAVVDAQPLVGQPIVADTTDRALLLLSDLPGVGNVSGALKPGPVVGSSDLVVRVEPGRRAEGNLSVDNHGNRYTGQSRVNGQWTLNSPRGVGDRLDLRATLTEEQLLSGRAAYDLPLNQDGLRGGAALSASRYELGREFARLDASGTARTAGAYASWPLRRGLDSNVWLSGTAEYRSLSDEVRSSQSSTDKHAQALLLEAYGDHADALGGGGYSTWRAGATLGRLVIDTAAARALDAQTARSAGRYAKLLVNASRLQSVATATTLALSASAQLASRNLDSSEKFVAGGAYGVRAYPQGEAAGDSGWQASVELRRDLAAGLQASLFYDAGGVDVHKRAYTTGRNTQTLRGWGLGLAAQWQDVALRASVAWRDGEAATTAPDRSPRAWLSAAWRF